VEYRPQGGNRRSPMPDFFTGAHAKVAGLTLLTRDAPRYRTYFPGLELTTPFATLSCQQGRYGCGAAGAV
jgi:predicted nucleic acid-binding protein